MDTNTDTNTGADVEYLAKLRTLVALPYGSRNVQYELIECSLAAAILSLVHYHGMGPTSSVELSASLSVLDYDGDHQWAVKVVVGKLCYDGALRYSADAGGIMPGKIWVRD